MDFILEQLWKYLDPNFFAKTFSYCFWYWLMLTIIIILVLRKR